MSIERVAQVLNACPLTGTKKVLAIGIANHDGDGGAWPTIPTLVRYAGVDRRNVQRALAELVTDGWLEVIPKGGGYRDQPDWERPNRYVLNYARMTEAQVDEGAARTPPPPVDNGAARTPPPPWRERRPPRGASAAPGGGASPAQTIPLTVQEPTPRDEPAARAPTTAVDNPGGGDISESDTSPRALLSAGVSTLVDQAVLLASQRYANAQCQSGGGRDPVGLGRWWLQENAAGARQRAAALLVTHDLTLTQLADALQDPAPRWLSAHRRPDPAGATPGPRLVPDPVNHGRYVDPGGHRVGMPPDAVAAARAAMTTPTTGDTPQ